MYEHDEDEWIEPEEILREEDDRLSSSLTISDQKLPSTLYILPLSERPFFPAQTLPILMAEDPWLESLKKIGESPAQVGGVLLVRREEEADATTKDFYQTGSVVHLHHPIRSDGKLQFIAEGVRRFRVVEWLSDEPPYLARVEYPQESESKTPSRPRPTPWPSSTP